SSCARRARYSALSMPALRMAAISSPRFSSVMSASFAWAALAFWTASSAVSHSQRPLSAGCGLGAGAAVSARMEPERLRTISSVICLICCSVNAMFVPSQMPGPSARRSLYHGYQLDALLRGRVAGQGGQDGVGRIADDLVAVTRSRAHIILCDQAAAF